MNDELKEQAKARIQKALKETQAQTQEAAVQLGGFLRAGAQKLRDAIRQDIDSRP